MKYRLPSTCGWLGVFCLTFAGGMQADVKLPAIISDHMVLKRSEATPVWGRAAVGEEVTVALAGQVGHAKANEQGNWEVRLDLKALGQGPFELEVRGKNRLVIKDVLIGEVWLASGQSNMEYQLRRAAGGAAEVAQSENPMLRQFLVPKGKMLQPSCESRGTWTVSSPMTAGEFSAVGYFFGKMLQKELNQPIGILNISYGSTACECWLSTAAIDAIPDLKVGRDRFMERINDYKAAIATYARDYPAWLKEKGREDKPVSDASAFNGAEVAEKEWSTVELPGPVVVNGRPANGSVWIRKEVQVAADSIGKNLDLKLGSIDGFEKVCWNGTSVFETSWENGGAEGADRHLSIPGSLVKGRNILAIRIFAPAQAASLSASPGLMKVGTNSLSGAWQAKFEHELPSLDSTDLASVPRFPVLMASTLSPTSIPSVLFDDMIAPIMPYGLSGVIWWQGETNVSRAFQYRETFPALIADWRAHWKQPDLPFYFCQLEDLGPKKSNAGERSTYAELRESQAVALKAQYTGEAVQTDTTMPGNLHPPEKKTPGERLALIALAQAYHRAIEYSGPVFKSMTLEDGKARLEFEHAGGGLVAKPLPKTIVVDALSGKTMPLPRNSPNSELEGFAICGEDRKWVWADAKVDGDRAVVVWSPAVPSPRAVRFGWADNPTCNLFNGANLPASPFRTDDFPGATDKVRYGYNSADR